LHEIYDELCAHFGVPQGEVACQWAQTEVGVDVSMCRSYSPVMALYKEALSRDKRVVFTSDTNHSRRVIREILERNGYPGGDLFVSSEWRRTKKTGHLFQVVQHALGLEPRRILHVGDTFVPDIWRAVRAGLCAAHSMRPIDRYLKDKRLRVALTPIRDFHHSLMVGLLANRLPWDAGYHVVGPICVALELDPAEKFALPARYHGLHKIAPLLETHHEGERAFIEEFREFAVPDLPPLSIGIASAPADAMLRRPTIEERACLRQAARRATS
jgi:hypothetical protein